MTLGDVRDQSAHFAAALAVVLAVAAIGHPIAGGAVIGLALGAAREITEGGNVLSRGSVRDLIFWTLGGAAAGLAIMEGWIC